ncbi:MAG TPA: TIGR04086 family membrane protein [Candidatus Limnocylindria bacterium]|jgi:putative membrane protein (TIGR04086 family)|nr:TIGR04086 family membrane protein [Candidatus Limnocylindria bacterium]
MSVLGGWIATIGAAALVAPAIAFLLARVQIGTNDLAPAVPVVIGIFISYLIGGYVAGRMAGYRTSWHGMMTAFFNLFVLLVIALLAYAADHGFLAGLGVNALADIVPGARDWSVDSTGNALTFGALLGFLAAIFAGWLGGVLAPSHAVVPTAAPYVGPARGPVPARSVGVPPPGRTVKREVVRERDPALPAFGRKGGDRVDKGRTEEPRDAGVEQP